MWPRCLRAGPMRRAWRFGLGQRDRPARRAVRNGRGRAVRARNRPSISERHQISNAAFDGSNYTNQLPRDQPEGDPGYGPRDWVTLSKGACERSQQPLSHWPRWESVSRPAPLALALVPLTISPSQLYRQVSARGRQGGNGPRPDGLAPYSRAVPSPRSQLGMWLIHSPSQPHP